MDTSHTALDIPEVQKAKRIGTSETEIYKMTSNPRGKCLIINNVNYKNLSQRRGSYLDEERFKYVFTELGFTVEVAQDLKTREMRQKLLSFSEDPLHQISDAAVLIIMAHGNNGCICGVDYKEHRHTLEYSEIVDAFSNTRCSAMKNKPKLCFIQACQGETIDPGVEADGGTTIRQTKWLPTVSELLISSAAQEGYSTARRVCQGGFYSRKLASVLAEYSYKMDLEDMLKMVEIKLRKECLETQGRRIVLSTTYKVYGWSKKLFFNPGIYEDDMTSIQLRKASTNSSDINYLKAENKTLTSKHNSFSDECSKLLTYSLTVENCIRFYQFSRSNRLPMLREKSEKFIAENFEKVCDSEHKEYYELTFEELYSLLSLESLTVGDHENFYRRLIKWLEFDETNRMSRAPRVLGFVDFRKCSISFLQEISSHHFLRDVDSLRSSLSSAMDYLRQIHPIFVLGGFLANANVSKVVEAYNTERETWMDHPSSETPKGYFVVFPKQNQFQIISSDETYCWSPFTLERTSGTAMPKARMNFCATTLGDQIYILGGRYDDGPTSDCIVYHPKEDDWATIPPMEERREYAAAATLQGKIYCAGGRDGSKVLFSVERYSPVRGIWVSITAMSKARSSLALIAHMGLLYALGGSHSKIELNNVEKYCEESKLWTEMPAMLTARSSFPVTAYRNELYVSGGKTDSGITQETEIFSVEKNEWRTATRLRDARYDHKMCVLPFRVEGDSLTSLEC